MFVECLFEDTSQDLLMKRIQGMIKRYISEVFKMLLKLVKYLARI